MAYMNGEKKAKIAANIKPILAKYGVKGTLSVRNHSTICLTIKSGKIDFVENYLTTDATAYRPTVEPRHAQYVREKQCLDVNPYWFHEHFSGKAKDFLTEAFAALKSAGWYDRSDAQVDYFDTAYYTDINVGKWNKPYEVTK